MNHPAHTELLRQADDVASRRYSAVSDFLVDVKGALGDTTGNDPQTLATIARRLELLALQRELFPADHFPVFAQRAIPLYRLAEDRDGRFALYVSAGLPGAALPPHDHTTWAVIAGVQGNERNVFYRRERTDDPSRDRLVETATVDVVAGNSVTMMPDDVHTIEVLGGETGLHLHFYGLGLDRLTDRVVFDSKNGGGHSHFAPPQHIRHAAITAPMLKAALAGCQEIALLDVREAGVFSHRHILLAASAPLWRLEVLLDRLVPRRSARIVLTDGGDDDDALAHQAAAKLVRLGWQNVSVLSGGTTAWQAAGYEIFSGSNVPSKALGEVIEHEKHTPWISADELQQRIERGDDIVVVDSRTTEEFADFSLPFAHSLPGAELVYRIQELAPRPETLVVVNCAGRTRSIVGAQTLIDAGIPNRVASLKDGTMAWLLAGHSLAHGRHATLPEPGEAARASARERAGAVAARAGVRRLDAADLARFEAQAGERTLYRFDVRSRGEYEAGHLPGWRWAPGGQLVQATDEYAATRHARVVLVDWDGVRALTTAAWLAQLGTHEVFVFAPPADADVVTGPEAVRVLSSRPAAARVSPQQADAMLKAGTATVFDVERRAAFEKRHVAGARFVVPDRLETFLADLPLGQTVLLTSSDGVLASSVAAELAARSGCDVRAIAGGTRAWSAAGLATDSGPAGVLSGDDDAWFSPYHHADIAQRDAGFEAYLAWELGLVGQLEREGDIGIRLLGH